MEAQGGEKRAKYGNKLIKEYSEELTRELGKGYTVSSLRKMRQFYLIYRKRSTVSSELSWSHYQELIMISDDSVRLYYQKMSIVQNLSVRELRERIKSKEYERIGYKEELEEPKINNEYMLHQLILENMDDFLKELGVGFMYAGHEVKIRIGDRYNYIDFLLFNYKFNCFVVIELKVTEMKAEYIGQVSKYINYVDRHIKEPFNDKTVGVIICRKENKFVLEYCSDYRVFTTTYELQTIN